MAEKLLQQNDAAGAAQNQQIAAEELLALAHALRAQRDKLETMKEARDQARQDRSRPRRR